MAVATVQIKKGKEILISPFPITAFKLQCFSLCSKDKKHSKQKLFSCQFKWTEMSDIL